MNCIPILIVALAALPACSKKEAPTEAVVRNEDPPFFVNPKFTGGPSVMTAARKIFPESSQIDLRDFWTSADGTHEFVVFFVGREIKGGFEGMYWRYLAFAKKKSDRDWASARIFDLPDNRFGPLDRSLAWLEQNAKELKAPIQMSEPTSGLAPGRGSP
ncbi:MAG: hypothetical protein HYV95_06855 [Opitutae bacterium]|nr:hypothetical protein [Opitutae bacterium]